MISKWIYPIVFASLIAGELAQAQYMSANYGIGMAGGLQACPYKMKAGKGAFNGTDEMKDLQRDYKEKETEYKAASSAYDKLVRKVTADERLMKVTLSAEAVGTIKTHITSNAKCGDYFPDPNGSKTDCNDPDKCKSPDSEIEAPSFEPFTESDWKAVCKSSLPNATKPNTRLSEKICDIKKVWKNKFVSDTSSCKSSFNDFYKDIRERDTKKAEKERLKAQMDALNEQYTAARDQWVTDQEEQANSSLGSGAAGGDDQAITQGDYCATCEAKGNGYIYEKPKTDWGATLTTVGLGLASLYGNYKSNEVVAQHNASLGIGTQQNYVSYLPGLMSVAAGVYGGITGSSSNGAFGCNPGTGGNGNWNIQGMNSPFFQGSLYSPGNGNMWGYPANYYNNPLASTFNQGLAPWYVGPNGALQGNLQGQFGLNNGLGNQFGIPGGWPGQLSGQGQFNLGIPGLGNQSGIPGLGNQFGVPGGWPGQIAGQGQFNLGVPGLGNQFGIPGLGNQFGIPGQMQGGGQVDLGAMQYQQQMMQMQLQQQQQQAQAYLQQQQQAAAQYQQALQAQIQRQQAASELAMQMQQLQVKYQMILSGAGTSYLGSSSQIGGYSGGLNGSFNVNTGGWNSGSNGLNFGVNSNGSSNYNPVINPNGTTGNTGIRQSR